MLSPTSRNRRVADASVHDAIQSVQKNQKFKRLMVFGLRALSDLCAPPTVRYKENSGAVLDSEAFKVLISSVKNFKDDDEVSSLLGKVFFGISEFLQDEPSKLRDAEKGGFSDAVTALVVAGTSDAIGLGYHLDTVKNLNALKVAMDVPSMAQGLLATVNPRMRGNMLSRVLTSLEEAVRDPTAAAKLGDLGAVEKVLGAVAKRDASNADDVRAIAAALRIVKAVAQIGRVKSGQLEAVISVMDSAEDSPAVQAAGSAALSCMVGPGELKSCLSTLKSAAKGSLEHSAALTTLSSMSYISSCANQIVEAGGIPMLCDAIEHSAKSLSSQKDSKTLKGLVGACKILASVGRQERDVITAAKGHVALAEALKLMANNPEIFTATVGALTSLLESDVACRDIVNSGVIPIIVNQVKSNSNPDVVKAGIIALAVASKSEAGAQAMEATGSVTAIAAGMANRSLLKNSSFQSKALTGLLALAMRPASKPETFAPCIDVIAGALIDNMDNLDVAVTGCNLLATLCQADGGKTTASAQAVDAVLAVMLTHGDENEEVRSRALNVVETVATEQDVERTLQALEASVLGAKNNPQRCLKSLAAVNGLSQVPRLALTLSQHSATGIVCKGMNKWVELTVFEEQKRIIRAGSQCIQQLSERSSEPLNTVIALLAEVLQQPGLKALRDKQGDATDNSLNDICMVLEAVCSHQRFTPGTAADLADIILRVMRKYPDARKAQCSCINALNYIAGWNEEGAKAVVESGALRSVIAFMTKVAMYEDIQAVAMRLMHTMADTGPKFVDHLQAADALAPVRNAARRFPFSAEIKKHAMALLSVLIAEGEIERLVGDNMREIDSAIKINDIKRIRICLQTINAAIQAPDAAKVAARCDLGRCLNNLMQHLSLRKEPDALEAQVEAARAASLMCNHRVGIANLTKNKALGGLITIFENIKDKAQYQEGARAVCSASKRLIQRDRDASETAFKRGFHARVCAFVQDHPEDYETLKEAAGVIGVMTKRKEVLKDDNVRRYIDGLCKELLSDPPREKAWALIEAMDELLLDPDDDIVQIILGQRGLHGVFKMMDDHLDDLSLVKRAQHVADKIADGGRLKQYMRKNQAPQLVAVGRTTKRVLKAGRKDAACCCMALTLLNKACTREDRIFLNSLDMLAEIEELMCAAPNDELLMKACGEYLGKLGCDEFLRSYMRKIVDTVSAKPAGYVKLVENLNNKLATYLLGDVDDEANAFGLSETCCGKLADLIKEHKEAPLLVSVGRVSRRLAKRFNGKPESPYGVKAMCPKLMPAMLEVLSSGATDPTRRPRQLLIDGFHAMAEVGRHPACYKPTLDICHKFGNLPVCLELLNQYKDDPEVVAAILDFLSAMASQPAGAEEIAALYKSKGRRVSNADLTGEVMALMKKHKRHPEVIEHGFDFVGNLGVNCKELMPTMKMKGFINDLNDLATQPKDLVNMMLCQKKLVKKVPKEQTASALGHALDAYVKLTNDESVPEAEKVLVAAALAEFVEACVEAGQMPELKKSGAVDRLLEMFENHPRDLVALRKVVPTLRKAAAEDNDIAGKIARSGLKNILGEAGDIIGGDYDTLKQTLNLLNAIAKVEGNGRVIAQTAGYDKLLAAVEVMCPALESREAEGLRVLAQNVKNSVHDDIPENLTLKQVYAKWRATRDEAGIPLSLEETQVLIRYWDFVSDYTEEYSKEPHKDLKCELGSEWEAGCKCYVLLHELAENQKPIIEKNQEPLIFLKAMARQKSEEACQCAVDVGIAATQWPETINMWANAPNAAAIVATVLLRGRKISVSNEQREKMLIPRMQLVERLAIERMYFNNTECMAALIGLWDDYDAGKYSVELLKQVFKSMRKIVNDHWVGIILKNNVPSRLIDVINDKQARIDLLPDVLFLLAALAVVPEIKTMIGDLKGVEACLDLLQRHMKNPQPGVAAVQTNDCLALSAITLGHGGNLQRFTQNRGLELNIECMAQSIDGHKMEYDVANAASLLMCNTCFKRDEMKELYGKKGACQAVMLTINKYDGSEDAKAFRCLATMCKAIGNLALFTPNVDIFMAGQIEKTFAHLYTKSERLPDTLMSASLRTLSNLAMENTETNMARFGVCLKPIIYMLKQGQRNSVTMFTLAFDVLGALCRLPSNAREFLQEDGIPTCLKILNSYPDTFLYANGIHVLGIQTTNPDSIAELIKSGVFNFLTSLLETQNNAGELNGDLAISGLRCIRRLLRSQSTVKEFIKAGGMEQTVGLLTQPVEHTMLHLEACRVILNSLALFPPPPPPPPVPKGGAKDGDWEGDVADEGVLPLAESLDRPPSPRSWESIELDATSIRKVVECLCKLLDREEAARQNRVVRAALGLLAYFACEKIPDTVQAFYTGNITSSLTKIMVQQERDPEHVKMCCYVLNNVAYESEPELYVTLRKDREMRKQLDIASQSCPSAMRSFCELTLKLLNERSADPARFEVHQQWEFPLDLTWWDKDKYPNGVQDLPPEIKEELRTGGKLKTIVGEKDRELLHWRSSQDLLLLNWRTAPQEGPWHHSIAISRVCSIQKGLASAVLKKANELGSPTSKPRDGECLVLAGSPTDDFPEGVEINILCGSKRSRDRYFEILNEWREAAAFGF